MTSVKLNTGASIPSIGLGTWQSPKGAVEAAVYYALAEGGYRHIDCAFAYGNEDEVGNGIKKAIATGKVNRKDIFITTKVFPSYHNRVQESIDISLERLQLDYVDLLLVHWPVGMRFDPNQLIKRKEDGSRDMDPDFDVHQTWKQFETVYSQGKAKAIGVSNFSVPILKDLLSKAKIVPAANQIECHPYLPQSEIAEFCKANGIVVEAYSPFGSTGGPLFENKVVKDIAEKHNTTVTSVLVSYHVSNGRVALPKTTTPARIVENSKVVALSTEDTKQLDQVHVTEGKKRYAKPDWNVDLKFPDWHM